jgi:hypothetical protein
VITVFSGSCDDLACITGGTIDYECQSGVAATASFLGEAGVDYFVLVQTYGDFSGEIGLTVTEFETVANDFCQGASKIEINAGNVTGTTIGASGGTPYNDCYYGIESPNVWYYIEGTGEILLVNVCSEEFNWTVSVLGGNCSVLVGCIGNYYGGFDSCTSIRFQSVIGKIYYIFIQGLDATQSGSFVLSVATSSVAALANDFCSVAELIDLNSTILGSTTEALRDLSVEDTCFTSSAGGDLWYKVVGRESTLIASTCGQATDFDSQISVYTSLQEDGSCSNLECVATNDDECNGIASKVVWFAEQDKVYFIRVHGFASSVGNFSLTVQEQQDSSSENCEAADIVELSLATPYIVVEGSTVGADFSAFAGASPCGLVHQSSEVWFKVPGQTGEMSASTCFGISDFDTVLEILQGSCGSLACVGFNDDDDDDDDDPFARNPLTCSTVTWNGLEGIDYYIRVSGFGGRQGDFELVLSFGASEETARGGDY